MNAPDATTTIRLLSWPGGFALARQSARAYTPALAWRKLKHARRFNGKLCRYRLELWEVEPDPTGKGEPRWIRLRQCLWLPVKTDAEARAEYDRQQATIRAADRPPANPPPDSVAVSAYEAQFKILERPYPVTLRILKRVASLERTAAKIGSKPARTALDKLNRAAVAAWNVETSNLIGKSVDGDANTLPPDVFNDKELAEAVADALRGKGTETDRVDYELAANWLAKYCEMTGPEYAAEIARVVGGKPSVAFILKRRQRLGLLTRRDCPGPRPRVA